MDSNKVHAAKIAGVFWLVPLLLGLAVNLNVLDNGFIWDDLLILKEDLPSIDTFDEIFKPLSSAQGNNYFRPIITLSFLFEYRIWGLNPFGYHLLLLLFHLSNTLLLFSLVKMLLREDKQAGLAALISSSIFAVHPAHVESVAWIVGKSDVIASFFMLLSFCFFIKYVNRKRYWLLACSVLSFFFGLLTKEVALSLLLVFPLYDLLYVKVKDMDTFSQLKERFLKYIPYLCVVILYFWLRKKSLEGLPGLSMIGGIPLLEMIQRGVISYGYYIKLFFLPFKHNHFIVDLPDAISFIIFSYTVIGIVLFFLWRSYQRGENVIIFAFGWFFLTLSPSILVALAEANNMTVSPLRENYIYIPSVGFSILLALFIVRISRSLFPERLRTTGMGVMLAALLLTYSINTVKENRVWKDEITFWNNIVKESPKHHFPYYNLGNAYVEDGRLEEAIREYEKAERINPYDIDVRINLGNSYAGVGKIKEAISEYEDALKMRPDLSDAHNNLGVLYRRIGKYEDALSVLKRAVNLDSNNADIRNNLGLVYSNLGRNGLAIEEFKKALRIKPSHRNAYMNLQFLSSQTKDAEKKNK